MPITSVSSRRRQRGRYGWYPVAEAVWALAAVITVALIPYELLAPIATAALVAPGAFFGSVRVVAAIADAKAGQL